MATTVVQDTADLGAAHVAGDTLIVTGKGAQNITDITTNLNQSAIGAGGFLALRVTPNFRAQFGTATTPLKAEVASGGNGLFQYAAESGDLWFLADGNTNKVNKFRMNGQRSHAHLLGGVACVYDVLEQDAGLVTVAEDNEVTEIRGIGGTMWLEGEAGVNPTTVKAGGNFRLAMRRGIAAGGNIYLAENAYVTIDAGTDTVPTIWQFGGRLGLIHSGAITTWNFLAGDAGLVEITAARPITVTTLNIWPGVRNREALLNHPLLTITTSNRDINAISKA